MHVTEIRPINYLNKWYKNVRNHIRRVIEDVWPFFRAQHVSHIKRLPAFEPLGVVGIDWETRRAMHFLMNLLRPSANVSERATFVNRPAVDVTSMM